MNRDFSKVTVGHTSRKNPLKRRDLKATQSNITRDSSLNTA
jgi:hypothetical protein